MCFSDGPQEPLKKNNLQQPIPKEVVVLPASLPPPKYIIRRGFLLLKLRNFTLNIFYGQVSLIRFTLMSLLRFTMIVNLHNANFSTNTAIRTC